MSLPMSYGQQMGLSVQNHIPEHRKLEMWLDMIRSLRESELECILPVLETVDAVQTLRKVIELCPALADPGPAIAARFTQPVDELMEFTFQLRQLAEFLHKPVPGYKGSNILTLSTWCRKRLESVATENELAAAEIVQWCLGMLARFDARFRMGLGHIQPAET